jgi:glucosamine kinase
MTTASQPGPLFVGVDGGGTGCRARLEDAKVSLLGTGIAGPRALRMGSTARLPKWKGLPRRARGRLAWLQRAEFRACCRRACWGRPQRRARAARAAAASLRSVVYVHDATIACIGAHGARDGGIVIVGTGSVGFAVVGGREVRVGGYGFPISDEGSGADLGLHAVRLALRAYDERAVGTSLTSDVMMRFHNDPFEVVAWMDHATATDYATFAPLVMRHADAGDPVGRRIVRDAAEQIDELVRRLSECGASRIALLGGLASSMQPWLAPDVQRRLVPIEGDAVDGALHLARRAVMKS